MKESLHDARDVGKRRHKPPNPFRSTSRATTWYLGNPRTLLLKAKLKQQGTYPSAKFVRHLPLAYVHVALKIDRDQTYEGNVMHMVPGRRWDVPSESLP